MLPNVPITVLVAMAISYLVAVSIARSRSRFGYRTSAALFVAGAVTLFSVTGCGGGSSNSGGTGTTPTVSSLAVTPATLALAAGGTQQLKVVATLSNGTTEDMTASATYTSSAAAVATVSKSGLVTAVAVGNATVSISFNGKTSTATVAVAAAPTLSLTSAGGDAVQVGSTIQLSATETAGSTTSDVTASATYSSSNTSVATVSSAGVVTGVAAGSAVITATYQGQTATLNILVTSGSPAATVVSVALTAPNSSLPAGTTEQLTATATYANGATGDVTASATYSSSNTAVATVSAAGVVTAVAQGTAVITASIQGQTTTLNLTVTPAVVASITVNPATIQIANFTIQQLQALAKMTDGTLVDVTSSATWSTTPSVATISASGLVTAVGVGTATITATDAGVSGTASLTVTSATLTSILLLPQNPFVSAGGTLQLTGKGIFSDGTTQDITGLLSFTTSNPAVATVSNTGVITGVAPGTVTITVTAPANLGSVTTSITFTVSSSTVQSITVTPATVTLAAGLSQQMTASATMSDGSTEDFTQSATWASSSTSVAIVNAQGLVTALNPGTTTITATVAGVPAASATVTVTAASIVSLSITPLDISLAIGQNQPLTVTATLSNGTTQDVTAQAALQVSGGLGTILNQLLSGQPLVVAASVGTGTVTASLDGLTAQANLTVGPSLLTGISIPSSITTPLGISLPLQVLGQYTDGSTQLLTTNLSYSSASPLIATVNALGNVIGAQVGSSNITVTYHSPSGSNFTASTVANISAATLQNIALTANSALDVVGIPIQLHALATYSDGSQVDVTGQVQFSSSNPAVALVSNLGIVTPLAVGATQVNASLNGVTGNMTLNIGSAVIQTIAVTAPTTLAVGATSHLTAAGTFSDSSVRDVSSQVSWSSSNPSIAIVDTNGNATGVAAGSANLIASLSGISGQAAIQVTAAGPATLTSITVTPNNVSLVGSIVSLLGTNTQFTATGNYSDGTTRDLTSTVQWSTSNSSAATINAQGQLQLTLGGLLGLVVNTPNTINVIATDGSVSGSTQVILTVL